MHTIRAAGIGDCEALANILQEYPDIPYRDPDRIISCLQESGFSEGSVFRCFIAELVTQESLSVVGYAMFSKVYSTFQGRSLRLCDIFVLPKFRKQGFGTALLRRIVQECKENGCRRIDCYPSQQNQALISLLEKHQAADLDKEEGWLFYQLSTDSMTRLAQ